MSLRDTLGLRDFNTQRTAERGPATVDVKTKARITRQKAERMTADEEYRASSDIYKTENPSCAYCGSQPQYLQIDHICSGTGGRHKSLRNPDTWNPSCDSCNQKHFSVVDKIVAKLLHVLRTIERLRGQRLNDEQFAAVIEGVRRGRE